MEDPSTSVWVAGLAQHDNGQIGTSASMSCVLHNSVVLTLMIRFRRSVKHFSGPSISLNSLVRQQWDCRLGILCFTSDYWHNQKCNQLSSALLSRPE